MAMIEHHPQLVALHADVLWKRKPALQIIFECAHTQSENAPATAKEQKRFVVEQSILQAVVDPIVCGNGYNVQPLPQKRIKYKAMWITIEAESLLQFLESLFAPRLVLTFRGNAKDIRKLVQVMPAQSLKPARLAAAGYETPTLGGVQKNGSSSLETPPPSEKMAAARRQTEIGCTSKELAAISLRART